MHSFEELNAKINRLKRDGGVGYTEPGRAIVFDNNTKILHTLEIDGTPMAKISNTPVDLSGLSVYTLETGEDLQEMPRDGFTIETEESMGLKTQKAWIGELLFLVSVCSESGNETVGLYHVHPSALGDSNAEFRAKIKFAETIHPISDKYLPGVCLPVVELSTEPTNGGVQLTDAEAAKIEKIFTAGKPAVITFPYAGTTLSSVFMCMAGAGFVTDAVVGQFQISNDTGVWIITDITA